MSVDKAAELDAEQHAPPAVLRPSVYDPPPYLNGPRHEYLNRCFPDMNPRVLARALDLCMERADPMMRRSEPPLMRVLEAVHNKYAPNVFTSRGTEAFLHWKIPQLRRYLDGPPETMRKALCNLSDALHDPEEMVDAVRQGIPQKVTTLMYDKMPWVRERCLAILETTASSAVGRDCILTTPNILQNIRLLMFDEVDAVRHRSALALRMLALFRIGPYDMDESELAPFLVYVLRFEKDPCILEIHLETLQFFLMLDETQETCIKEGAYEVLDSLKHKGDKVGALAMKCLQRLALCSHRRESVNKKFLNSMGLHAYLSSDNPQLNGPATAFLSCLTLTTPGKITAYDNDFHVLLLKILQNPECPNGQLSSLQALTNMSEYPPCGEALKTEDFDIPLASDEARKARDRLVHLLTKYK